LARIKAELELAEADGTSPPVGRLLEDLEEAFAWLSAAEDTGESATRVVIVDDDNRLAEITAKGLRRLGFDARASASLGRLKAGEVLILDLGLLDALDEAELEDVRAARPIIVTGAADRASRARGERVNATDYLVKPVDLKELRAAINRRTEEGRP
jgi:two-component system nitrogen regulation response regulator GlnG